MSQGSTEPQIQVVPNSSTGVKSGIAAGILGLLLALWHTFSPLLPEDIRKKGEPVIQKIEDNKDIILSLEEKIENLSKKIDSQPAKEIVEAPIVVEIKVVDSLGEDATGFTVGTPLIVTSSGKKKEWITSVGKAKLLTVPDGFVVIPIDNEILVFSVRVGSSSAIKVLKPKQIPEDEASSKINKQLEDLNNQVKDLSSSVSIVQQSISSLDSKLSGLESRVKALEAPRPPPNPVPTPDPPVVEKYHLTLSLIEDPLQRTVATASLLNNLASWNGLKDQGHDWRLYDKASTETTVIESLQILSTAMVPLPAIVIKRKETGKICYWGKLPESMIEVKQLVTKYSGE